MQRQRDSKKRAPIINNNDDEPTRREQQPLHSAEEIPDITDTNIRCGFERIIPFTACLFVLLLLRIPATRNSNDNDNIRMKKQQPSTLHHVQNRAYVSRERMRKLPARLQYLMVQSQIVGNHLEEVKEGKKTVEEIIHGGIPHYIMNSSDYYDNGTGSINHSQDSNIFVAGVVPRNYQSAPMTLNEVLTFLQSFLKRLSSSNIKNKHATYHGIWSAYHDLTVKWMYPWDQEYLRRMPPRRQDDSIFLSVVSFRDEYCADTLKDAFGKAKNPQNIFVALIQQNCEEEKCHSGMTDANKMEVVKADPDCYLLFCSSVIGKKVCDGGNVRLLRMKETESLGPYMARYFASKLWQGEEWYMQIDAHTSFAQDWDVSAIDMLKSAPSERPVISHYPPPHTANLTEMASVAASRVCGPVFATNDLECQIVRFEGSYYYDSVKINTPRFAPFVSAGYLMAHSGMLRDVPFDPFLPYLFTGEEIILSARLWTSGYDIFSPSYSIVQHRYARNHRPKFWETIHRVFTAGVHNSLQMLVLQRIKEQLGYPESAKDMVKPKSLFTAVDQYSMGSKRKLKDYLDIVGLNMNTKEVSYTAWCEIGIPPPGFEKHLHLYQV